MSLTPSPLSFALAYDMIAELPPRALVFSQGTADELNKDVPSLLLCPRYTASATNKG